MRAVLDTNVFVSATLIKEGTEDRVVRAWRAGRFDLVVSPPILEEIGRAMLYEKLAKRRWMTRDDVSSLIRMLARSAALVDGTTSVTVCRDSDDDKFLAAALEGKARWVVSGDKDLLAVEQYMTVAVVRPTQFLRALSEAEPAS
jgi:hypothetical protein